MPEVFRKEDQFDISSFYKLGVLPFIGKNYVISFQLFINKFEADSPTIHGILHFTSGGLFGDVTPAFSIGGRDHWGVASAINGNSFDLQFVKSKIATKKWYSITISQLLNENGKASISIS